MTYQTHKTKYALAFAIAGILAVNPAISDKPAWAGGDKGGKSENRDKSDNSKGRQRDNNEKSSRGNGGPTVMSGHFGDRHRTIARDYYSEQFRGGRCPPGLAKKNNGCLPPGQARKWTVGRALPREVIYYDVPPALVVQFGQPQSGYRYVRVASDILLIAIATGIVMDAIQDYGR